MNHHNPPRRRTFMLQVLCGSGVLAASAARAADPPVPVTDEKLTEADPYAKSMGFRLDSTKVDQARYPRHTPDQKCSACQLFGGAPNAELGPCSFFGGRQVNRNGWCRNFKAKKAA